MTTTPPGTPSGPPPEAPADPGDSGPRATRDEIRDLGRLRRSVTDRKVAGVAGGLARHLDIDPVILRVAFVVLAFFGGAGLILYAAAWALVPEEGQQRAPVDLDERSRTVALIALGVVATLALIGDSWGAFWFPWPLIVIGLVVGLVWLGLGHRSPRSQAPAPAVDPVTGEPVPPGPADQAGGIDPVTGEALPPAAGWTGGPTATYPTTYAPAPRPRDPRKRGPVLFWFTLALIAFSLGVLGIVDLAGVAVADSVYPAVAVGVTGVMLLVGSFLGRAGGLILVGLLGSVALAGTTAAAQWDGERIEQRPTTAAAVQDSYRIGTGRLVVDLSDVTDVEELDGRTLDVTGDAGRIEVVVPEEMDVQVDADVDGPGGYELFGSQGGGIDFSRTATHDGGVDAPSLTIDARMSVGEIVVTTE